MKSIMMKRHDEDNKGSSSESSTRKKQVHFGPLTIDEYPIRLGEDRVPRAGAPIALGDCPVRRTVIGLDHFENVVRPDRRRKCELFLSEDERASILLLEGYSIQRVSEAASDASQRRSQRLESSQDKEHQPSKNPRLAKALNSTSRAIKSLFVPNLPLRNQSVALVA